MNLFILFEYRLSSLEFGFYWFLYWHEQVCHSSFVVEGQSFIPVFHVGFETVKLLRNTVSGLVGQVKSSNLQYILQISSVHFRDMYGLEFMIFVVVNLMNGEWVIIVNA